jgi:alpha-D-ribose 1-methylphosphonate 5-triphosphate diphosphatase
MWLTNLQIVLPERVIARGALRVEAGQIAEIIDRMPVAPPAGSNGLPVVDGEGLTLIPGAIDMHGDMIEQEVEPRTGARLPLNLAIHELDRRMAAAGVTTSYASISFWEPDSETRKLHRSGERAAELAAAVAQVRPQLLTDLRVHARYELTTPVVAPPLRRALEAGQIQLLSLMDHTPGQGQYRDVDRYVHYLVAYRNMPIEQLRLEAEARMRRAQEDTSMWDITYDLVGLAKGQGLVIASHDDDTPEKVALMHNLGVTISEFPVSLVAAQAARQRGMHVAMGAPNALRGLSHSGNLSARDAITAGLVDLLAADYAPAAMIQAVWALASAGMPLHTAVALITANPADALSLTDRGRIAVGAMADLVLVESAGLPRVRATIRAGRPIYWDAEMHRRAPWLSYSPQLA